MLDLTRSVVLPFTLAMISTSLAATELDSEPVRPERIGAEIVLTDSPYCTFFVVSTGQDYSLLSWRGGYEIFAEGDRVRGPLTSRGVQEIELVLEPRLLAKVGPLTATVLVEDTKVPREVAKMTYDRRCRSDRPGRAADDMIAAQVRHPTSPGRHRRQR